MDTAQGNTSVAPLSVGDVVTHLDSGEHMRIEEVADGLASCSYFIGPPDHRDTYLLDELQRVQHVHDSTDADQLNALSADAPLASTGVDQSLDEELSESLAADGSIGFVGIVGSSEAIPYEDDGAPLPSEVLYGFMAWLTCRNEIAGPFSQIHEAGQAAVLVDRFCKSQGYELPRADFPKYLKPYPQD